MLTLMNMSDNPISLYTLFLEKWRAYVENAFLGLKRGKVSGRKSIRRKIETYDRRYATTID